MTDPFLAGKVEWRVLVDRLAQKKAILDDVSVKNDLAVFIGKRLISLEPGWRKTGLRRNKAKEVDSEDSASGSGRAGGRG